MDLMMLMYFVGMFILLSAMYRASRCTLSNAFAQSSKESIDSQDSVISTGCNVLAIVDAKASPAAFGMPAPATRNKRL